MRVNQLLSDHSLGCVVGLTVSSDFLHSHPGDLNHPANALLLINPVTASASTIFFIVDPSFMVYK